MTFGAHPPEEHKWQIGKTAAVIKFVKDAIQVLQKTNTFTGDEANLLRATITRMKDGSESLSEFQAVDDWLYALRNHHP